MDSKTRKLLHEADWDALRKQLLSYTAWRASTYRWNRGGPSELAEGYTVEDVVQEVIVKALSGIRRWDPHKGPLLPWLQAQSRSVLDALAKSAPHRHEVELTEDGTVVNAQSLDPLETLLEKESEACDHHMVKALLRTVQDEPELHEVLRVILEGCEPRPRYIASELGIPRRDVDNRLKRLRRRAARLCRSKDVFR